MIIDPLFQMRDATTIGGVTYTPDDLSNPVNYVGKFGLLGRSPNGAERLLVRFLMPVMPAGTEVEKAYLLAAQSMSFHTDQTVPQRLL